MDDAAAQALLNSLGIPVAPGQAAAQAEPLGENPGRHLERLLTDEVIDALWQAWHPGRQSRLEAGPRRDAFRKLLGEGLSMGLSVVRFRDLARALLDPSGDERRWAALFEDAVAGGVASGVRIGLSPRRYKAYADTNAANVKEDDRWDRKLSMLHDGMFYELGIVYPPLRVDGDSALADTEVRVEWNDAKLPPRQGIRDDQILVNDTKERLALLGVESEPALNPANGNECALIGPDRQERCEQTGLTTWNHMGCTVLVVSAQLRLASKAFVHRHLVDHFLRLLGRAFPTLVRQAREHIDGNVLSAVLRGLVEEQVSIRDVRSILEVLLMPMPATRADLAKHIVFPHNACQPLPMLRKWPASTSAEQGIARVRISMKRYLSHKATRGQNTLICYLIDPSAEGRLRQTVGLTAAEHEDLIKAVANEVGSLPPTAQNPVILTTTDIRRRLRDEIRHAFPVLAVLSYDELNPDMNIQPIARIDPELEPCHESLYRLFGALRGAPDVPPAGRRRHETAPANDGDPLLATLDRLRGEIVRRAHESLERKHLLPPSAPGAGAVLERYVDACREFVVERRSEPLERLIGELSRGLADDGVQWSALLTMPFEVSEAIRSCLASDFAQEWADRSARAAQFDAVLDRIDQARRTAARIALDAILRTGLGGASP